MLWRSAPLTSNARSFAIVGEHIVAGYGFTAEPDFLFLLDRATGKPTQTVPVPNGPEYIVFRDDKVFVRTYDRDMVFQMK